MDNTYPLPKRAFPTDFLCTLLSVAAFSLAIPLGVLFASALQAQADMLFTVQYDTPYAGCDLFPEYAVRAAKLCLPTLLQLILIWGSAYVRFEKPLLAVLFFSRGLILGMAVRCSLTAAESGVWWYLLIYTVLSLAFCFLIFHIHTKNGVRPFSDSLTAMMITGGFCCMAVILTSLPFFSQIL